MKYSMILSATAASAISLGKRQAPCPVPQVPETVTVTIQAPSSSGLEFGVGSSLNVDEPVKTVLSTVSAVATETHYITSWSEGPAPGAAPVTVTVVQDTQGTLDPVTITKFVTVSDAYRSPVTVTVTVTERTTVKEKNQDSPLTTDNSGPYGAIQSLLPSVSGLSALSSKSTFQASADPSLVIGNPSGSQFIGSLSTVLENVSQSDASSLAASSTDLTAESSSSIEASRAETKPVPWNAPTESAVPTSAIANWLNNGLAPTTTVLGASTLPACDIYAYDKRTFTEYVTDPFFNGISTRILDQSTTTITIPPQPTGLWKRQLNLPLINDPTLDDTLAPILGLIDPILSPITSALEPLISPLSSFLAPVISEVESLGNVVQTIADPLVSPILSQVDPVLSAVHPIISVANPALSGVISALLPAIKPVPSILEPIASGVADILTPIFTAAEPVITGVLTPIDSLLHPVESGLISLASPIVSLIQPAETAILNPVGTIVDDLLSNVTSLLYPIATPLVSAILSDVTSLVIPPVATPIICELVASDVENGLLGLNAGCTSPETATTIVSPSASVAGSPSNQVAVLTSNSTGSSTSLAGSASVTASSLATSTTCTTSTITIVEVNTVYKNLAGDIIPVTSTLTTPGCANSTSTLYVVG